MKPLRLVSPKFLDHIGGMESHGVSFAEEFLDDPDFPIERILSCRDVSDGIPAPACAPGHAALRSLLEPILTGDFDRDAAALSTRQGSDDGLFFLNSPTWLPALTAVGSRDAEARLFVRTGGNDLVAGWLGNEHNQQDALEETRGWLVNSINEHVDTLIVNSLYTLNRVVEIGVEVQRLRLCSGGVDCSHFRPAAVSGRVSGRSTTVTVLTSARLVSFKGLCHSLDAFRQASERLPCLRYLIAGDGPERPALQAIVDAWGLGDRVQFLGAVDHRRMPDIYRRADLFLHLPIEETREERGSRYVHTETMGRSYCEAAASGLPAIGSKVGGVAEMVVDGQTGFLVDEGDSDGAADHIERLATDRALRQSMARTSRALAEARFDWSGIFNEYRRLFARKPPPRGADDQDVRAEISKYDRLFADGDRYNANPDHDRFTVAEAFVRRCTGKSLLDVGTGRGHFFNRMVRAGFDTYGVEPSATARARLGERTIVPGYSHAIPFSSAHFDIVVCLDVLEHVPDRFVVPSLEEIARVARGVVVLSLADHEDIVDGERLHISQRPFPAWRALIEPLFTIIDAQVVCSKADASKTSEVLLLRKRR